MAGHDRSCRLRITTRTMTPVLLEGKPCRSRIPFCSVLQPDGSLLSTPYPNEARTTWRVLLRRIRCPSCKPLRVRSLRQLIFLRRPLSTVQSLGGWRIVSCPSILLYERVPDLRRHVLLAHWRGWGVLRDDGGKIWLLANRNPRGNKARNGEFSRFCVLRVRALAPISKFTQHSYSLNNDTGCMMNTPSR